MERKALELLKKHLDKKEKSIIDIFEIVNRDIISNVYLIEKKVLEGIINYFKDRNDNNLDRIWGSKSIQKKIFLYCISIWEIYVKNKELKKEDIEEIVKEDFLKSSFLELYPEILKVCEYNENTIASYLPYYKNDTFSIDVVNLSEYEKAKRNFSYDEIYFRIVFKGIIKIGETIVFQGEGYFSKKSPVLENITPITEDCSQIIIAIKTEALRALGIEFNGVESKKIKIGSLKLFDFIIKKQEIGEQEHFKVYQLIVYLAQMIKNSNITPFNVPYLKYKREILEEVEKNYLENERYIVERLSQNLNFSIPTLYKIFNILFDESPTKYIERRKLNYASSLLVNTNESIENISHQLGYSRRTFTKKFLDFSGYMPIKFREMMVE